MTYEKYEKAQELRARMNYIEELEWIFENATSRQKRLAALGDVTYKYPGSDEIASSKIINHNYLTEEFRDKFLQVLRDEYEKTEQEFEAL